MPLREPIALPPPSRALVARPVAIIAALIAIFAVTSFAGFTPRARAATTTPPKAVIIVGPTHSSTARYLDKGEVIARQAEAQGMDVRRVFHPHATWANVKANIQGAAFVVYLGHGNGWPSPYGSFQEETKDGFGLNAIAGGSTSNVKYYGANFIRRELKLAPNAVVLLQNACYTSGNGEPGMAIPTRSVAIQRVDNFASGFLAVGAAAVFAYEWGNAIDLPKTLMTTNQTLDSVFMTKGTGDYNGFVGASDFWVSSVRTSGAQLHLDPNPAEGYIRAVSGRLSVTTEEWRGGPAPTDTVTPVLSAVGTVANTATFAAAGKPTAFTPNGDGVADTLAVSHTVSESGYLDFEVTDATDGVVRRFTASVSQGTGTSTWDGRNASGVVVPDGTYALTATPRDRAGNVGVAKVVSAQVLTALRTVTASPVHFHAADADAVAATTRLGVTVTKPAVVSWRITDAAGTTVRTNFAQQSKAAGALTWTWDGKDDAGDFVRDGIYFSTVSATTPAGTVTQRVGLRAAAFAIYSNVASVTRGQRVTFTITTAEPLSANPTVTVTQPGLAAYTVATVKSSTTRYTVTVTTKTGGTAGTAQVVVTGKDANGQSQSTARTLTVQ